MSETDVPELTTANYLEAADLMLRIQEKHAAGEKLSKKERAIITYAALMAASDRSADMYRQLYKNMLVEIGEPMPLEAAQKARSFETMLTNGIRAAESGLEVGEPVALRSILTDFREVYSTDLLR
ncbi:hypothetical protein GoPhGRU1p04 [Gordonia phage GRU1]|uniref:Uncharacterized protein n=1 Tax=Gordonia phage GRU1 TaxID=1109710 RepID=G8EJW3_9CAUD|nr:hypothetical protein GoPhGRU1p04 [Gordonia phage GRU1]AET09845.1 hypothetical protein [Gordonia phage GRU1]WAA19645.1 hypothetical protein SEA_DALILPOP_18 [Gordonia phage Dalilpop]